MDESNLKGGFVRGEHFLDVKNQIKPTAYST